MKLRLKGRQLEELNAKERKKIKEMSKMYVIAFYNIGIAEECRGNREKSLEGFENAVAIGR